MTKAVEIFAWTERDVYKKHDEMLEASSDFVKTTVSGETIELPEGVTQRSDLTAHLRSLGYEIDALETLQLQHEVVDSKQKYLDSLIDEDSLRYNELFNDLINRYVPSWRQLDAVELQEALADDVCTDIEESLDYFLRQLTEAPVYHDSHLGKSGIIEMILSMQRQLPQEKEQEIPPDKPPLQGVVQVAGIQEVDKG